jgi:hypothetical protein
MNDSLISHIVPITYFGGTGGFFLTSLLVAAKLKNQNSWVFSTNGNSHQGPREKFNRFLTTRHNLGITIEEILELVKKSEIYREPGTTYYNQFHLVDLDKLMQYFSKSIRICYSAKDIREVSLVMSAKHGIDGNNVNSNNLSELKKYCSERMVSGHRLCAQFQPIESSNVLCVDWNMLLRGNPDQLFDQLHSFTGLENFSLDNLLTWRELTLKSISNMQKLI